jgi:hypothetical protein
MNLHRYRDKKVVGVFVRVFFVRRFLGDARGLRDSATLGAELVRELATDQSISAIAVL